MERQTRFHTCKQNNRSLPDSVVPSQLLNKGLFADFAAAQILDRASGFAKELVRSSLDSVSQLLSKTAEVLDQYPAAGQIDFQSPGLEQWP
jgi:hypothetical protein